MKFLTPACLRAALASILIAAPLSHAAPVKSEHIDSTAKWMVHLDINALLKTDIAQHALEQNKQLSGQKLEALKNIIGIDLKTQLHGATLFGNGQPDNAVVIIHADAKPDNLVNFAKLNDAYKEEKFQDFIIHSLPDEKKPGKRNHICFYSSNKVVVAPSADSVKLGVELLNGSRESIAVNGEMEKLGDFQETPVLIAYGDFSSLQKGKGKKAETFKQAKRIGLSLGEVNGYIKGGLAVVTENAEVATQIESFLRGVIAIGQLGRENNPALATLADAMKVTKSEADIISVEMQMPTATLIEIGETMKNQKKKKKSEKAAE
jgi:hypothetical protein